MSDKVGGLVFLGILAAGIGISLLLSRDNPSCSQGFIEPPETHSAAGWVKAGRIYENMEHWHISWDIENLIPTDITISRHAVET